MVFNLDHAVAILTRTPATLNAWLSGLPSPWVENNEGPESWSPYDVLGHLIHGELTDWIPRTRIVLGEGETRAFEPFDRFAQFKDSRGKSLDELLAQFTALRHDNLRTLQGLDLKSQDFQKSGLHPELGRVTLGELLATWVTHDLGHIAQIARTMAKQYTGEVGAWRAYIPILDDRKR